MRATGIVRRIDDLGRVAIPKEIRRSMGIKEGDPLEIFINTDNNCICLKKYSSMEIDDNIAICVYTGLIKEKISCAIFNKDRLIAGPDKYKRICVEDLIEVDGKIDNYYYITIISCGYIVGYIIYEDEEDEPIIRAMSSVIASSIK